MGTMAQIRHRMIERRGRPMQLIRQVADAAPLVISFRGFARAYRPDEAEGAVQPNDQQVETLDVFPFEPRQPDRLMMDGRTSTVQAARPIHEGTQRIGWTIWVRG